MNKWYLNLSFALIALLLLCCTKEEELQATGQLTVNVQLADIASRAQAADDSRLYEGNGIEDITVMLVNSSGIITFIKTESNLTGAEQQTKTVTVYADNLKLGQYTLYVFGNTKNTLFAEVRTLLEGLRQDAVFDSQKRDALFTALDGTNTPKIDAVHPLLLTASKTVQINIKNNTTSIELIRPIVKFEVQLYNHSDKNITVTELGFSKFNPSTGYLLPHDGDIPSTAVYRDLPAYDTSNPKSVAAAQKETVYETALFENRATEEGYLLNMTLHIDPNKTAVLSNKQLMIVNSETSDIEPMTEQLRNQHVLVTVNAYYNTEKGQFEFEVEGWKNKEENVEFD